MDADAIRKLRARLKMTAAEFGRRVLGGASRSYVSHLEAGRKAPTGATLHLLRCADRGVPPQKLDETKPRKKIPFVSF